MRSVTERVLINEYGQIVWAHSLIKYVLGGLRLAGILSWRQKRNQGVGQRSCFSGRSENIWYFLHQRILLLFSILLHVNLEMKSPCALLLRLLSSYCRHYIAGVIKILSRGNNYQIDDDEFRNFRVAKMHFI